MNKEERRQRAEKFRQEREREAQLAAPVSYTHLTLPTT